MFALNKNQEYMYYYYIQIVSVSCSLTIIIHSSMPSSVPLGVVVDILLVFVYHPLLYCQQLVFRSFLLVIISCHTERVQVSQSDRLRFQHMAPPNLLKNILSGRASVVKNDIVSNQKLLELYVSKLNAARVRTYLYYFTQLPWHFTQFAPSYPGIDQLRATSLSPCDFN